MIHVGIIKGSAMRPRTESRLQWLHFEGASTRAHSLPANVLVKSIHQLQRVVYLLAKFHRGEDLGQRLRMPKDLEDRFELICKIPVEGSYALPCQIGGGPVDRTTSLDDKDLSDVCRQFKEVTRAIGSGNIGSLSDAVPSPAYRAALLKAYRAMQPPKRYGVDCSIEDVHRRKLLDGAIARQIFPRLFASAGEDTLAKSAYVAGTLMRIDFDKHRLWLKQHGGRVIEAAYRAGAEPDLLEHPRGLIQVHGDVLYDRTHNAREIADVDEVRSIDESSIEIDNLYIDNVSYRANPPFRFSVHFDQKDQLYDLDGDFNITVFAESRSDLDTELREELRVLWLEYAQGDPKHLSKEARKLRKKLRARLERIP